MTLETVSGLPRLNRVLAIASQEGDESLLSAAAALAAQHGAGLDVLSCVEPPRDLAAIARAAGVRPEAVTDHLIRARRTEMEEVIARFLPECNARLRVRFGKAFMEIIRDVLANDADMVVKAVEPLRGLRGALFGSTDLHLLRKCPCPVWLREADSPRRPHAVIAAVDVDDWDAADPQTLREVNQRVLGTALGIAAGTDAVVHAIHAWDAIGEGLIWAFSPEGDASAAAEGFLAEMEDTRRRALADLVKPFRELSAGTGPRIMTHLAQGPAHVVLSDQAVRLGADVIVLGTIARTGLPGVIIGNTAENILNSVACSVVAVKPAGFQSPITG